MPGRLPTHADFPSSVKLTVTPAPSAQQPTNVLVLLHGLGDTNVSFTRLGQQLHLPETACVAVQAPAPLPFDLGGFHWGDDMVFDPNTGEMDMDTGFKASTRVVLDKVIREGLVGKCGYQPREIMLFGFGQGGMVGLQSAAELEGEELGGVVSVGGRLPASLSLKGQKSRTPVLICRASRASAVTDGAVSKLKDAFEFVEIKDWKKNGDSMPSSRDEMMPIMQFFARRLRSTKGVPAGSVALN